MPRAAKVALAALLGTACAAVTFGAWRYHRFDAWLDDAGSRNLLPYSTPLVAQRAVPAALPRPELDTPLVEFTTAGRLVVELSRSEYYFGLGGDDAWVKTYLETSKPGADFVRMKLKLLHHLRRENGSWRVESVTERAMP